MPEIVRTLPEFPEGAQTAEYLRSMIEVGRPMVLDSRMATSEDPNLEDVAVMYRVLEEIAPHSNPILHPSWWEHTYESGATAEVLGSELSAYADIDVPKFVIDMIGHDWGRLAIPNRYYRNDAIRRVLFRHMGFHEQYWEDPVSITKVLDGTISFDTLTPTERAAILIDNLAKRTATGEQFTLGTFNKYLDDQGGRYPRPNKVIWPSEWWGTARMRTGEDRGRYITRESYFWLQSLGISYEHLQQQVKERIPVVVYLMRHGETNNKGLLYNWDEFNHYPVGLTDVGFRQLDNLAGVIAKNRVSIHQIYSSDIYRARQSAETLLMGLQLRGVTTANSITYQHSLRDTKAQAAMARWSTMEEFDRETNGGNVYTPELVAEGVESLSHLQERWVSAVNAIRSRREHNGSLHVAIIGHGDPIRAYIAALEEPGRNLTHEDFTELKSRDYIGKGEGWRIIFTPDGKYLLKTRICG